jgi:lysozyme
MTTKYLAEDISQDEGCKLVAYPDPHSGGDPWTIGFGTTGSDVKPGVVWTMEQAVHRRDAAIALIIDDFDNLLSWWRQLSDERQDVLVNMAYNMGVGGVLKFNDTLAAMKRGDYEAAAHGMLSSLWHKQLPERSGRLAEQMRTGLRAGAVPEVQPQPTAVEKQVSWVSKYIFNPIEAAIARAKTSSNPVAQQTGQAASAALGNIVKDIGGDSLGSNSVQALGSVLVKDMEDGLYAVVDAFVAASVTSAIPVAGAAVAPEAVALANCAIAFAEQHALTYISSLFAHHKAQVNASAPVQPKLV